MIMWRGYVVIVDDFDVHRLIELLKNTPDKSIFFWGKEGDGYLVDVHGDVGKVVLTEVLDGANFEYKLIPNYGDKK